MSNRMSIKNISKKTITSATHTRTQTRNAESSQQVIKDNSKLWGTELGTGTIKNETENRKSNLLLRDETNSITKQYMKHSITLRSKIRTSIHLDTKIDRNI